MGFVSRKTPPSHLRNVYKSIADDHATQFVLDTNCVFLLVLIV